jgi:hypothetical protein
MVAVLLWVTVPSVEAQTSPLTIQPSTGRVGIGTTTPGYPLDVTGTVNATTFRGDGSQLTGISAAGKIVLGHAGGIAPNNLTWYFAVFGGATQVGSVEQTVEWVAPLRGTVSTLYVYSATGTPQMLTITVRKNRNPTSLTCLINSTSDNCNNVGASFTVEAGERLTASVVGSAFNAELYGPRRFTFSMLLVPLPPLP